MKLKLKRTKKFFNRASTKLGLKAPKMAESPREAALVQRLRKRQSGEGFSTGLREEYE